jgi:hypothetical protein
MRWAPRVRTWIFSGVKARWVCRFPYRPIGSLRPGSNGLPAVYKTAALPGELRRHRVLGAIRTHTAEHLGLVPPADWATRTSEPPSGADPDRPPYEGGAAAVRGGEGFRGWTRTSEDKGQGLAGDTDAPPGTGTGGEIRTLKRPGLSRPGIPVPVTPAWCAARGSNPVSLD